MLDQTTGNAMGDAAMFAGGNYVATRDFQSQLAALDEEYRQRREAIARELLGSLTVRESVLMDELRDVRAQKDKIKEQFGTAPTANIGVRVAIVELMSDGRTRKSLEIVDAIRLRYPSMRKHTILSALAAVLYSRPDPKNRRGNQKLYSLKKGGA
jgi:hypothetical protein